MRIRQEKKRDAPVSVEVHKENTGRKRNERLTAIGFLLAFLGYIMMYMGVRDQSKAPWDFTQSESERLWHNIATYIIFIDLFILVYVYNKKTD